MAKAASSADTERSWMSRRGCATAAMVAAPHWLRAHARSARELDRGWRCALLEAICQALQLGANRLRLLRTDLDVTGSVDAADLPGGLAGEELCGDQREGARAEDDGPPGMDITGHCSQAVDHALPLRAHACRICQRHQVRDKGLRRQAEGALGREHGLVPAIPDVPGRPDLARPDGKHRAALRIRLCQGGPQRLPAVNAGDHRCLRRGAICHPAWPSVLIWRPQDWRGRDQCEVGRTPAGRRSPARQSPGAQARCRGHLPATGRPSPSASPPVFFPSDASRDAVPRLGPGSQQPLEAARWLVL